MSARFLAASSQHLLQTGSVIGTNTPFTIGCWVWFNGLPSSGNTWGFASVGAAAASRGWDFYVGSSGQIGSGYWNGAGNGYFEVTGGATNNVWTYVLFRSISTTNRRISCLRPGAATNGQNTGSFSTAALDCLSIGAIYYNSTIEVPMTGSVAEYFYANADIQPGGAQMDTALLQQLAHRGPFSVPSIVPMIVDYQSLRKGMKGRGPGDGYQAGAYRQWAEVNGPTIGGDPPLASDYVRPNQTLHPLLV